MANRHGTLIVRSEPSGTLVTIDDVSKTTPAIFDLRSKPTHYIVRIEKIGYYDNIQKVVILPGSKIEISIVMTKIGE